MLKYILVSLLFVATTAEATDRNGQFSVGGNLGFVMEAPWASDGFKDRTKPGLPKTTVLLRYHHDNSYTGGEVSLDYFALGGNDLNSTSALISFFWRFMPNKKLHPILSAGTGYSKNENFFSEGDFSKNMFRLRAGVEYEMTPKMDLTFHLDHYFASHNKFSDISLAVLAPSVGVLFYFERKSVV